MTGVDITPSMLAAARDNAETAGVGVDWREGDATALPLQQFGTITAIMIGYASLGAVAVLPSLLVLWTRLRPEAGDLPADDAAHTPRGEST